MNKLRDHLAGLVMKELLVLTHQMLDYTPEILANESYKYADAMLKERDSKDCLSSREQDFLRTVLRLRTALSKIASWELPETGEFWDEGKTRPVSYGDMITRLTDMNLIKELDEAAENALAFSPQFIPHHLCSIAAREIERLQRIIDSRPAINAGLPETYIEWSQGIYMADYARAKGQQ